MVRIFVLIATLGTVACAPPDEVKTLGGVSIMKGGNPDAVVDTIDVEGLPGVFLSNENGEVRIGVFQAKTGVPYLQLLDSDHDGAFDLLTYSSISAEGELLVDVHDYGMDGQPDFILNYKENTASVFYENSWYEVIGMSTGQRPTVTIHGTSRQLKMC